MRKTITLLFTFIATLVWQANAQISTFPYTEDFESGSLPTGWVKELPGGSADNDITISTSANHTPGGQYSVRFSSWNTASDYNQYLFTDTIHVTSPYTQLTFWVKKYNSAAEQLQWGISTGTQSSSDVSTWTDINLTTSWEKVTVDLSAYVGQNIFFAWHYYGNYLYYVYLDDVKIDEPPACPEPSDLDVSNITSTEAEVSWTENGSATNWNIEYGQTGFTQGTGTTISVTSNPYTLTGLTPATTYDIYVQADCGASGGTGTSIWVGPYTFTTLATNNDCANAQSLDVYPEGSGAGNEILATTDAATDSGQHPSCDNYGTNLDLWYSFTAPTSGHVKVITGGPNGNYIEAAVYDSCGGAELDCQDQSNEKIFIGLTAGQTYILQVWHDSYNHGEFTIVLEDVPVVDPVFNLNANPDCGNDQFSVDVNVIDLGGASSVTISDDQGSSSQQLSAPGTVTFGPYASGTNVTFTVTNDDDSSYTSSDNIQFYCPPANDLCSGAIDLTVGQTCSNTVGTNQGATDSGVTTPACASYGYRGGDVWFKFTAPETDDGTVIVETSGVSGSSVSDTGMAVYTGDCSNLTEVDCNDDGGTGLFSKITLTGVASGTQYYVRVWEYGNNSFGEFNVCAYAPNLTTQTLSTAEFSLYPNPTSGIIRWNASQSVDRVQVTNLTGQVLMNVDNPAGNSLDISRLPQGVYLLNVQIGDKQGTYRLIKE